MLSVQVDLQTRATGCKCVGPVLVVAGGGVLVANRTFDKMHAHLECDRRGGYATPQAPTACRCTSNVAQKFVGARTTMWFQELEPCCLQDGHRLIHNVTTVYHINRLPANSYVDLFVHLATTSIWQLRPCGQQLRAFGIYVHLETTSIWQLRPPG